MSSVGQPERATQNRVVKLFEEQLGYTYLDDWQDRSIPGCGGYQAKQYGIDGQGSGQYQLPPVAADQTQRQRVDGRRAGPYQAERARVKSRSACHGVLGGDKCR